MSNIHDYSDDPEMQAAYDAATPEQRMMTIEDWMERDRKSLMKRKIILGVVATLMIGAILIFIL